MNNSISQTNNNNRTVYYYNDKLGNKIYLRCITSFSPTNHSYSCLTKDNKSVTLMRESIKQEIEAVNDSRQLSLKI